MSIPGRMTLLAGPRLRLAMGGGKLWVVEDRHVDDRAGMAVVIGIGAAVMFAGVVVVGGAVQAPPSTLAATIAQFVLGAVIAASGIATLLYAARRHGALESAADDWGASDVLAEADSAAGVFVDRVGGRVPLSQVQVVVHKRPGLEFLEGEPTWWIAIVWAGHALDIAPFTETLSVTQASLAASRVLRTLHAFGFATPVLRE
ncbi:MAG: hypothetical protein IAG13_11675 [Deltaproteobacteria bacterium]|nr:hypothetical protein [Nannocystaceae bacterium]